ncbi:unnamed protein product [Orchesella dallaii]|uniref:Uncharacterized protein n=1 Tax=Orchesella dallaii TaxID=48710 RepID=A0ABP1PLL0_9HEXA
MEQIQCPSSLSIYGYDEIQSKFREFYSKKSQLNPYKKKSLFHQVTNSLTGNKGTLVEVKYLHRLWNDSIKVSQRYRNIGHLFISSLGVDNCFDMLGITKRPKSNNLVFYVKGRGKNDEKEECIRNCFKFFCPINLWNSL